MLKYGLNAFNGKVDATFLLSSVLIYRLSAGKKTSHIIINLKPVSIFVLMTPLKKTSLYSNKFKEIE